MDIPTYTYAIKLIRRKLKRLKDPTTILVYEAGEKNLNLHMIREHRMYLDSKNKLVCIDQANPEHRENIIKKLRRL